MQSKPFETIADNELPLFPLNVVLFPGALLPLHIFENRYRQMTQFCIDHKRPFGVVLIKSGREVGEAAMPHRVGTTAKIIDATRLEDGRMNLITIGQHRFEIAETRQDLSFLVGRVRIVDRTEGPSGLDRLAQKARESYRAYETSLAKLFPQWEAVSQIPIDAQQLAYQIGTRLQAPLIEKQRLLETYSIEELLVQEIELLEVENEKLRATLVAQHTLENQHVDRAKLREKTPLN